MNWEQYESFNILVYGPSTSLRTPQLFLQQDGICNILHGFTTLAAFYTIFV